MAQHDYVIANGTGAAVRSDLNNALAAIVSQNSGATEPATTYAFQFWADTTTGTLKLRNSANSAWIELLQLDGTLTMEDGTEALPGLSFRNDLDTGLWRPGANQLAISTNAVERVEFGASEVVFNDGGANYDFRVEGDTNANLLFVDASADAVGIGTSTVDELLHLKGASTASTTLKVESTATASERSSIHFFNGSVSRGRVGGSNDFDGLTLDSSTTESAAAIRFRTGGTSLTTKMTLTSGGSLGIGTTSAGGKLHVSSGSSSALVSADADELIVENSGNSGITIASPNSGTCSIRFADPQNNDSGSISYNHNDETLRFATFSTERARFDSSGRWLLGTSSSSATTRFEVYGQSSSSTEQAIVRFGRGSNPSGAGDHLTTIQFAALTSGGVYSTIEAQCDGTPGTNDYPGRLTFSTTADGASSPTERMRIHNGGCVSVANGLVIGSLGAVTNSINISGSVIASGAGNSTLKWNTSSGTVTYDTSSRLVKNQIVNCPYGISEIKQLQPRKYFRTDDQREEIGFIADEMIQVMPEFVPVGAKSVITKDENDTEQIPIGVNYEKLTAVLVKALQEAVAKIESLEARLTAAGI